MTNLKRDKNGRILFTKKMKKEYTILLPMMAPIHFELLKNVLESYGYNAELLDTKCPEIVSTGLKYVHNDTCYPAILVIGQFIHALKSGKYDINKVALMITQTGGGCRASNYIHLLRKALKKAGFENVPVISLNLSGFEKNSGFKISLPMIRKMIAGLVYGDALMLLSNQTKPYENNKGDSYELVNRWIKTLSLQLGNGKGYSKKSIEQNLDSITSSFSNIPTKKINKVKVGIVGEIYVKYSSLGNNNLEEFLEKQNCEVFVPGILEFMLFKVDNRLEDIKLYGGNKIKYRIVNLLMKYLTEIENVFISAIKKYNSTFTVPSSYEHIKKLVDGVIGYGNKMGEGWLLTAEMLELAELGYENIVCTQPFGCLPNHICGKGMVRKIKSINDNANIVTIDYDPSATKVNQENRIKLMLSLAKEKITKDNIDAIDVEHNVTISGVNLDAKQYSPELYVKQS